MDEKCPKMATDAHHYKDRKNIVLNKLNDITLGNFIILKLFAIDNNSSSLFNCKAY